MSRRKSIIFFVLAALFLMSAVWVPAQAVPRQCVIFEGFTQWNCPPCASWNPTEDAMMAAFTADTVIAIKYHAWWPGANNDIYHLWNVSENTARINMYGVDGVPSIFTNGYLTYSYPFNSTSVRNGIRNEYSVDSPCSIELNALYAGGTAVNFSGSITAESDISGLRLFVALLTNEEHAPPQGSNGETSWANVFRDMYPNANNGQLLSTGAGETTDFEGTLVCDANWDPANMTVVAFVQNIGTRQIVQGTHTIVEQNYGMETTDNNVYQQMIDPEDEEHTYTINLHHIGLLDDEYSVQIIGDFPDGWSRSIEADGVDPQQSAIDVPMSNGESTDLVFRVNSNGNPGFAEFTFTILSTNEPLVYSEATYRIMGGLDILIVDDDDGDEYQSYYSDILLPYAADDNKVLGVWDVDADLIDNSYFSSIDLIVWLTGDDWQSGYTISVLDQLMLMDFLNAGGSLLLSGQGIGLDIRLSQFWGSYLHLSGLVYPNSLADVIEGYAGDPLTDGLLFDLDGGDGADNQNRQHRIIPNGDGVAQPILRYVSDEDSMDCAVRVETATYRVIYFGFGLEGISSDEYREDLMTASVDWLLGTQSADDPEVNIPTEFSLGQNYPNPFNPETVIPFSLAERSMVTLNVYDILGREVAQLVSGAHEAGIHSVNWNASNLSSGIYFYTLEAISGTNTFKKTRKLVLMK